MYSTIKKGRKYYSEMVVENLQSKDCGKPDNISAILLFLNY